MKLTCVNNKPLSLGSINTNLSNGALRQEETYTVEKEWINPKTGEKFVKLKELAYLNDGWGFYSIRRFVPAKAQKQENKSKRIPIAQWA